MHQRDLILILLSLISFTILNGEESTSPSHTLQKTLNRLENLGLNYGQRLISEHLSKCIPQLTGPLAVKDYRGGGLFQNQKEVRPTLVVLGTGDKSKEELSQLLPNIMAQTVLWKSATQFSNPVMQTPGTGPKLLILADLDEVTLKAQEEMSRRQPEEFQKVMDRTQQVVSQVSRGLFSRLVYRVASRQAFPRAAEVFGQAYPAIGMGMTADGVLHGGEWNGEKKSGVIEEMDKGKAEHQKNLSIVGADLDLGFVMDLAPYASVASQADSAVAMSAANGFEAKFRRGGLFGNKTVPRRRVFRNGAAAQIDEAHGELVAATEKAKEGAAELAQHANDQWIRKQLMASDAKPPVQIAILAPDGSVMKRYSEGVLEPAQIAKDYNLMTALLERKAKGENIETDPDDPECRGKKLDSDGDGVPDSKDRCPGTPAGSPVHPFKTVTNGFDYSGCAEGQIPVY